MLNKLFCKHNWEIIQDVTTKCKAEVQSELVGGVSEPRNLYQHEQLYGRKHITILKCTSCGKLKRFVEEV